MQPQAQTFINSSIQGSTNTLAITWPGGKTTLVIAATTQFGLTVQPHIQALNGQWFPICSNVVSNQIFTFDAPAGQYRIAHSGSSIGLSATLSIVPT